MSLGTPSEEQQPSEAFDVIETYVDEEDVEHTFSFRHKELQDQVERLCRQSLMKGAALRPHLLRYLLWLKLRPAGWQTPKPGDPNWTFHCWARIHLLPTPDEPKILILPADLQGKRPHGWDTGASGKTILWEFYNWAKSRGFPTPDNIATSADTDGAGRHLAGELRGKLDKYYAENNDEILITIPPDAISYQLRFKRPVPQATTPRPHATTRTQTSSDQSLRSLLKAPVHSYHLTLGREGKPHWSYKLLTFQPSPDGTMVARGVNLPRPGGSPADREKNEYDYEASLDRGHLVIRSRRADGTGDISIQLFPHAAGCNFPLSGIDAISNTWKPNVAASTISILSRESLTLNPTINVVDGEPITDLKAIHKLVTAWRDGVNIVTLPSVAPAHSAWDDEIFAQLLKETEPGGDGADLSIVSSLFHSVQKLGLKRLLFEGCRIEIIVMNPANHDLIYSRYKLREDFRLKNVPPEQRALKDLVEQIDELRNLPNTVRKERGACKGTIEVRVSDLMPCGFFVLTRKRALLGTMLCYLSYDQGGPMVEATPEDEILWGLLQNDWAARWSDARDPDEVSAEDSGVRDNGQHIISDARLMTEKEAHTPDGVDIWVAAHDLSNVGDGTSQFSELVRKIVSENAGRGINYTYVYPRDRVGRSRVENLRRCFLGKPGKLHLYPVPEESFQEITLVPSHFISFNPLDAAAEAYMQLPLATAQKGWIKLDPTAAGHVLAKMKQLMEDYPDRRE